MLFSGDLNTGLVWYWNGHMRSNAKWCVFKCHLNTGEPNHLNTGQMDAILFSDVLVWYLNGQSRTADHLSTEPFEIQLQKVWYSSGRYSDPQCTSLTRSKKLNVEIFHWNVKMTLTVGIRMPDFLNPDFLLMKNGLVWYLNQKFKMAAISFEYQACFVWYSIPICI